MSQDSARFYADSPEDRREDDGPIVHRDSRLQNASTVSVFYVQDEWKQFAPLLRVLAGCRVDHSTFTRERVYSPRLSLTYMLDEDLALRAGWGYFYQATHFVSLFERLERQIEWNLFEINLLNRRNVYEYYWNEDYSRRLVSYMLPRMPFFGIRLEL